MKCFHEDADCREDCAIFQEEYKTCAFYILPVLLGMIVKQQKELTEMVETLAHELMADRADGFYLGENLDGWDRNPDEWEEAQKG